MRKLIVNLVLIALSISINAQTWLWSGSAVCNANNTAHAITSDASGNIYVIGYFNASIQFGNNPVLSNAASCPCSNACGDVFLTKYNPNGNVLWSKSIGGSSHDYGAGVITDNNGNVYIVGAFRSNIIQFGNLPPLTRINSVNDYFIAKYDSSGNAIWSRNFGVNSGSFGTPDKDISITLDANSNIYLAGAFYSSTIQIGTTPVLTNNGSNSTYDIFIAKYDSSGNALWSRTAGGINDEKAYSITTDASGYIYIAGYFYSSSIQFGNTPTLTNTNNNSRCDIFIAKYDPFGNALWSKSAGATGTGNSYDMASVITTDVNANVYIAGAFQGSTIQFGSLQAINNSTNNAIFITKYDSSGNAIWAKHNPISSASCGFSGMKIMNNDIYLTGFFACNDITFGNNPMLLNTVQFGLWGIPSSDIFLVKYDTSGNALWSTSEGGSDYDFSRDITVDTNNNIYIAGGFYSSYLQFGTNTVLTNNTVCNTVAQPHMYVAKFRANFSLLPNSIVTNPSTICQGNNTSLNLSGGSLVSGDNWNWYTGSCGGTYVISGASPVLNPTTSTTYWVRAEGTANTTTCVSVTVVVGTLSIAATSVSASPVSICFGQSSTIGIVGGMLGTNANWNWYIGSCGGVYLASGTTITQTPTITTTYYVRAEGLCNTTNCISVPVTVIPTSIVYLSNEPDDMNIYPNPVNNSFTIKLNESNAVLKLYNLNGQLLKEVKLKGIENTIDIKDLSTGVYIIEVVSDKNTTHSKIIKE